MKVFKITTPNTFYKTGGIYHGYEIPQLDKLVVGTKIEVLEMTAEEYNKIPCTSDSEEFFCEQED